MAFHNGLGTDARNTTMAPVVTKTGVDLDGIRKSCSESAKRKSYFSHGSYIMNDINEIYGLRQDELTFMVISDQKEQLPRIRSSLNGVMQDPKIEDLIVRVESSTSIPKKIVDEMIHDSLMRDIMPVGSVIGDGYTMDSTGKSSISSDLLSVFSAGTLPFLVRDKPLGIGMEAEFRVPLHDDWVKNEEWNKSGGKLTLFLNPVEKQSRFEKMSRLFHDYNFYENEELWKLVHDLMRTSKKEVPHKAKMVYATMKLVKTISILARQKNISSGMFRLNTDQLHSNNAIPSFKNNVFAAVPDEVRASVDSNSRIIPFSQSTHNFRLLTDKNVQYDGEMIIHADYNPEKFNMVPIFYDKASRNLVGRMRGLSNLHNSLDVLVSLCHFSDLIVGSYASVINKKSSQMASEMYVKTIGAHDHNVFKTIVTNNHRATYNTLMMKFLPQMRAEFYRFGFEKNGMNPVVNSKLFTKVTNFSQSSDGASSSSMSVPSSMTLNQELIVDFNSDFGRASNQFTECFPSFLQNIIHYFEEMDNGFKITVVDPADYGENATGYIRA